MLTSTGLRRDAGLLTITSLVFQLRSCLAVHLGGASFSSLVSSPAACCGRNAHCSECPSYMLARYKMGTLLRKITHDCRHSKKRGRRLVNLFSPVRGFCSCVDEVRTQQHCKSTGCLIMVSTIADCIRDTREGNERK